MVEQHIKDRIELAFTSIGAKATVEDTPPTRRVFRRRPGPSRYVDVPQDQPPFELDVVKEKSGEVFKITLNRGRLSVLDKQANDRHLLLLHVDGPEKAKFLCGHDERHWFTAAIPENAPVKDVISAKLALKPKPVREEEERLGLKIKRRLERHNKVSVRQGEWFFIRPRRKMDFTNAVVTRNEEISRGRGSTPHVAEFACRFGGTKVYVHPSVAPNGTNRETYLQYSDAKNPDVKTKRNWSERFVDAILYVKGRITHPDHATIILDDWHRVEMNTEHKAKARSKMVFLD